MKKILNPIYLICVLLLTLSCSNKQRNEKETQQSEEDLIKQGRQYVLSRNPVSESAKPQSFIYDKALPQPSEKKLSKDDLKGKNIAELWMLRNSYFAKHGRPFRNYELHGFFMKQPWYKPNENFSESDLSENDKYNVQLIERVEQELRNIAFKGKCDEEVLNFDAIYNLFQYPNFSEHEKELISKNGFLVAPTNQNQLFHIYENNDYLGIPSFITVDAILQLYHLYFDMTLRNIQEKFLYPKLKTLLRELINELINQREVAQDKQSLDAINFNIAYLSVPYGLLGKEVNYSSIESSLQNVVKSEIEKCNTTRSFSNSALMNYMVDYSLLIPRGHYTRSEELGRFFKAMMWLGNVGIEMDDFAGMLRSSVLSYTLNTATHQGRKSLDIWEDINDPIDFYVGSADDIKPTDLYQQLTKYIPQLSCIDSLVNEDALERIKANLERPRISGKGSWGEQEIQLRLLGQRYVPDSEIFHHLSNVNRKLPNSLDIMASFGNKKAYELMMNEYAYSWANFPNYQHKLDSLVDANLKRSKEQWTYNLYYHWLYNLTSLFGHSNKYENPFFMTTEGWERKALSTSLASWAELRHNTILFVKQSMGAAECGGGGDGYYMAWVPEPPKGYVEPNVEFYERMLSLINLNYNGLKSRSMIQPQIEHITKQLISLIEFLKNTSIKQLTNQPISLEEYEQIRRLGSLLENLTLRVLSPEEWIDWWQIDGPDKNMPVIADVHTIDENSVLQVGVGKAHEIYVVVEIDGRLKLCRGAVFSFYEFTWSLNDRLTDESWQKMLERGEEPEQPKWINYRLNSIRRNPVPLYKPSDATPRQSNDPGWKKIYYDTGC